MKLKLPNIFKRKKRTYSFVWKHSFNDEVIIYPTEEGWEKINSMFGDKYIEERKTEDGGYKDRLWNIIEDMHDLFYHGADYIPSNFEIIEKW